MKIFGRTNFPKNASNIIRGAERPPRPYLVTPLVLFHLEGGEGESGIPILGQTLSLSSRGTLNSIILTVYTNILSADHTVYGQYKCKTYSQQTIQSAANDIFHIRKDHGSLASIS